MKKCLSVFLSLALVFFSVPHASFAEETIDTTKPKVSVIIPVYNTQLWLRECLDSLKNQTLKEIEIICVDDGSTDESGQILDEYAAEDKRFKIIHQENKGIGASRNVGCQKATGEYITFVDSDDYLQPDAYEVAYYSAKKDNVDILQFQRRNFQDGKDDHTIKNNDYHDGKFIDSETYFLSGARLIWLKLFKSELINKGNVRFKEDLLPADDDCFSYMTTARAKSIKVIPTKLYNHRFRPTSVGALTIPGDQYIINNYKLIKYVCDDCRKIGFLKDKKHLLLSHFIKWSFMRKNAALKLAKEILDSFADDIYNPNVINKCNKQTQQRIKELEAAAKVQNSFASNETEKNTIHIAMATDDNYVFPTIVSMTSILENRNSDTKIDFYMMLSGEVSQESKNKILSLQNKYSNCNVTLIDMKDKMKELFIDRHLTTAVYYRLMLPSLLPDLDKVLYLDTDIIAKKDLSELFNYNLNDYYIAGVPSVIAEGLETIKFRAKFDNDFYMQKYGTDIFKKSYINSGIMLFNLKNMRKDNIEPKLLECAKSHNFIAHDQCTLNMVCYGKILNLPSIYNKASLNNWDSNQVILHYLGRNKPWNSPERKNAALWWEYAQKTDYFKEIKQKYMPTEPFPKSYKTAQPRQAVPPENKRVTRALSPRRVS